MQVGLNRGGRKDNRHVFQGYPTNYGYSRGTRANITHLRAIVYNNLSRRPIGVEVTLAQWTWAYIMHYHYGERKDTEIIGLTLHAKT
jgi:hypothetical protein